MIAHNVFCHAREFTPLIVSQLHVNVPRNGTFSPPLDQCNLSYTPGDLLV
jgi:hypothetical protein